MDVHNQKIEEAVESSKDGSGSDSSYSMTTQSHYYPKRHIISAASSVVSGNSYGSANSSGTSLLPMPTAATAAIGGGMVAGLQMQIPQQQQQLPFVPEEAKVGQPTSNEVTNNNNALPTTLAPSAMPSQPQKAPVTTVTSKQIVLPMGAPPHPVAEFLFQLTKMLTDNNSEYIEWRNASIVVHNPPGLEKDILPKYFRHSNYSSFQRQMNYFGFRKIAGKGKMAPCSYVNEKATSDISSLLFIKRKKTGVSSAAAKLIAEQNRDNRSLPNNNMAMMGMNHTHHDLNSLAFMGLLGTAGLQGGLQVQQALQANIPAVPNASYPLNTLAATRPVDVATTGYASQGTNASLLLEQQSMLAQLQQAHAAALNSNTSPPVQALQSGVVGQGQGGRPQQPQSVQIEPESNVGFVNNDQGNIYISNNNNTNNNQALFQHAAGLSRNFPQAVGGCGLPSNGSSDNLVRIDSAASLRALLNQQISMFNTSGGAPFAQPNVNVNTIGNGMMQAQGQGQAQAAPQQGGLGGTSSAPNQGGGLTSFDWNTVFQQSQSETDAGADSALQQFQQQLLQGNNNGTGQQPFNRLLGSGL